MVAVGNHRAAVRESPIHGSGDPGRDRLHAAAEPIAVASFDDQVNVVALDGVVSEARWASVTECGEGRLESSNDRRPPHLDGDPKVSDNCCESTLPF